MKVFMKYVCLDITVSNVNERVLLLSVIENKQGTKTARYSGGILKFVNISHHISTSVLFCEQNLGHFWQL